MLLPCALRIFSIFITVKDFAFCVFNGVYSFAAPELLFDTYFDTGMRRLMVPTDELPLESDLAAKHYEWEAQTRRRQVF